MHAIRALLLKDLLSLKNIFLLALRKPLRWLFILAFIAFFVYRRFSITTGEVAVYPEADEFSIIIAKEQEKVHVFFAAFTGLIISAVYIIIITRAIKRNTSFFVNADTHFLFSGPFNPRVLLMYQLGKSLIPSFFSSLILIFYFFLFISPESISFSTKQVFLVAIPFTLFVFSLKPLQFLIFSYVARGNGEERVKHVRHLRNFILAAVLISFLLNFQQYGFINVLKAVFNNGSFQLVPVIGWFHASIMGIMSGEAVWWAIALVALYIVALPLGVYRFGNQYYEDILASTELKTRAEQFRSSEAQLSDEVEYSWAINTKKIREHTNFGKGAVVLFWKNWVMAYRQTGIPVLDPSSFFAALLGIIIGVTIHFTPFDREDFNGIIVLSFLFLAFLSYSAGYMRVRIGDLTRPQFALIPDTVPRKLFYFLLLDLLQVGAYTLLFYAPVVISYGDHFDLLPTTVIASIALYLLGFLFQLNARLRIRNVVDRYLFLPLAFLVLMLFAQLPSVFLAIAAFGFFKSYGASFMTVAFYIGVWSALLYIFAMEEIDRLEY
ncbi:MAG: putative ABC exporter domain-containing protein [Thermaurantimonas sp.]|uniref:putative ABC exporter domain-containing protein n=1 Tax=Thermaurantimonas sp. TaxID=2681568 RepID=UPI00391CE75F